MEDEDEVMQMEGEEEGKQVTRIWVFLVFCRVPFVICLSSTILCVFFFILCVS